MEISRQRLPCHFQRRQTLAVLECSLLAFLVFVAILSLSCQIAAARLLDVAFSDEFGAADGTNSNLSVKSQESESDAQEEYEENIPRGHEFLVHGVYLKEEAPEDARRLPPTPPIVHGVLPPCPAPRPPEIYYQAASGDKEETKGKKETKGKEETKENERHGESPLLCDPIL